MSNKIKTLFQSVARKWHYGWVTWVVYVLVFCGRCIEVRHRPKHSSSIVAEGVIRNHRSPRTSHGHLADNRCNGWQRLNRWPSRTPGHLGATVSLPESDSLILSRKVVRLAIRIKPIIYNLSEANKTIGRSIRYVSEFLWQKTYYINPNHIILSMSSQKVWFQITKLCYRLSVYEGV